MRLLRDWIEAAPGWLLVGALVFAPWALGSTTPEMQEALQVVLVVAAAAWLVRRMVTARRSHAAAFWKWTAPALLLALLGCAMAWNAHGVYVRDLWQCVPVDAPCQWGPGAIDQESARAAAPMAAAILLAFVMAVDLGAQPRWRERFLWAVALTGASIALLGLAQRFWHAPSILWIGNRVVGNFFGTYRSLTNASAFLNLTGLVGAALLLVNVRTRGPALARALLILVCVATFTAALLTGSRGGGALALAGAALVVLMHGRYFWEHITSGSGATLAVGGLLLLAVLALATALMGGVAQERWAIWESGNWESLGSRRIATQVAVRAAAGAGFFGFGPGAFHLVFPHYTATEGDRIRGYWEHAHNDYLEWLIDWGWLGAAGWLWLFFGPPLAAWFELRRNASHWSREARTLIRGLLAAWIPLALMAACDFPMQIASIALYALILAGLLVSFLPEHAAKTTTHPR